ncbi:MAG: hypothetical protein ACE5KZ_11335 [Candidatus Scalinduaceae bacterium]
MTEKEFERRNFLDWYCRYATQEEIKKAKKINKKAIERLIAEYEDEIEKINKSKHIYELVLNSKQTINEFGLHK